MHTPRLALALVLLAPAPSWAAVVAAPAPLATVTGLPAALVPGISAATPALAPAALVSPALAPTLGSPAAPALAAPAASLGAAALPTALAAEAAPAAVAAPAPVAAAAAPAAVAAAPAPAAPARESVEAASARAASAFDQSARLPEAGLAPAAAADAGVPTAAAAARPAGDDGGGPDYPHRTISFRGQDFRSVYFRPNVPVEDELVRAIDLAQTSIHLALYEFKAGKVLDALRRARERGVEIHIVIEESYVFPRSDDEDGYKPRRSNEIWALLREDYDVKVLRGLGKYGINHNKIAVIDAGQTESLATFGSYNWSWTAEKSHYENANFTVEHARVDTLMSYWTWLDGLAQPVKHGSKAGDFSWPKTVPPPPVAIPLDVSFNGTLLPSVVLSPTRAPGESIEDRLAQALGATRKSIKISIFALRSTKIAEALAAALKRGVNVSLIMDEGQAATDVFGVYAQWLAYQETVRGPHDGHIEVRTLSGPDPASDFPMAQKDHHKFSILDDKIVETGSANYTKSAAENNFENAHFLDDATDVKSYAFMFAHMWARAKPFAKPETAPVLPTDAELQSELDAEPGSTRPAPGPEPTPARPQPRRIPFHGKTYPSFAFRPDTPIEPQIVDVIRSAKKTLRLALYEFTLDSVLDELRAAKKRGVKIEIVIDHLHVYTTGLDSHKRARMPSAQIQALIAEDFDVLTLRGKKGGIQHNKYVLADAEEKEALLMFGSYNLARTAEDNHYENVKFSNDKRRIAHYLAYFEYQRGLASGIDQEKLDEVLSRTNDAAAAEPAEAEVFGAESEAYAAASGAREAAEEAIEDFEAEAAGGRRGQPTPPPPQDTSTPVDLNGEKFQLDYFSPGGGVRDAWIRAIKAATTSVEIAMFSFYSRPIADALVEMQELAAKKGITIRLVLDAGQASLAKFDGTPVGKWFAERGFDVHLNPGPHDDGDPMYEKQHSKFILIDRKFLMTGSFNASDNADQNSFENENVIDDPTDIAGYVEFFERLYQRGWHPTKRRGAPPKPAPMPGA